MKNISFKLTSFLLLLSLSLAVSAKVSFQLIPRTNVISGTNFQITLRLNVEDESIGNVNMPTAPVLEGCRLLSGPNQTTSQRQTMIINGRESTYALIDLTCVYRAGEPGKVKIPPVSINVGGKTYTTNEGSFEILPPDSSTSPSGSSQGLSNGSSPQTNLGEYFVRVIFSKSSVYEQEGVIASTKLYRPANNRTGISLESVPRTPVYEGFLSQDLEANPEGQVENYNGKNYYTYELSRVLLFPQKSGTLKVTSGTYTLKIQEQVGIIRMHGFPTARYEEYTYTTPLTTGTINVKALPEPRPADFCGAVGQFSVTASLNPDILRTNESTTYKLTFKGTGNVKYLTVPTIEFPSTFDKYSTKTDVNVSVAGQTYSGSYSIDYPLVPQEVGQYEIPAQTFSYFNLANHKYEQISVQAINIDVKKGAPVAVGTEQKSVDASMKDILHIHTLPEIIEPVGSPIFKTWFYWLIWGIALLFLIIAIFVYRRNLKLAADVAGRKNARANRVATKRFKAASAFMKNHQDDKFYEELARALKGYISDKLSIAPSGLISSVISEKLKEYGVADPTIENVLYVLDECEMARFTPNKSESAMQELYQKASAAIKSIEDTKRS